MKTKNSFSDPCDQKSAVTGPCEAYIPSFSYIKEKGKCEKFIYGGCKGNNNRFGSLAECQDKCVNGGTDPCDQKFAVTGPCYAAMPRFSYNKDQAKCEKFIYGGCKGNDNRFGSLAECQDKCENGGTGTISTGGDCVSKDCGVKCGHGKVCNGHGDCLDLRENPCSRQGCGGLNPGDSCLARLDQLEGAIMGRCNKYGWCINKQEPDQFPTEMIVNFLAYGNSKFGQSWYDVVRKSTEGNIVMSPYSASSVMAMATAGAKGKTLAEMKDTMRFPWEQAMCVGYESIFKLLRGNDNFTLETANKMYVQDGYQLVETFTAKMREFFNTEATLTNFAKSEEATKLINGWVEEKTRDKIKDLIPTKVLNGMTRLVLVNAIYFKGDWASKFDESRTSEEKFYVGKTETIKAKMMKQTLSVNFKYIKDLHAEVVELPYKGDRLSMYIVLPKGLAGLSDVENKLNMENVHDIFKDVSNKAKRYIVLPKFKLEQTLDMKEHFQKLGITRMFVGGKADFSGMAGAPGELFVSKIIQKAFIEVNEKGSEAAAATAVVISGRSGRRPKRFVCNHPFMFFIRDKLTEMVLFSS